MNEEKKIYSVSEIFRPGGIPTITYVSRDDSVYEKKLKEVKKGIGKLCIVTGMTKFGKTVLVDKVFSKSESIWVNGGAVNNEDELWETILSKIGTYTDREETVENTKSLNIGTDPMTVSMRVNAGNSSSHKSRRGVHLSTKTAVITEIENLKIPIIIDDFHYIDRETKKKIVRVMKGIIMSDVPVIFIAIPNHKNDVIEVEKEMTERILSIEVPVWPEKELVKIAQSGFAALGVDVSEKIIEDISKEAFGSPFLMQEFCKRICEIEKIEGTSLLNVNHINRIDESQIFENIAEQSGKEMFEKLKRGPRARSDRKKRILKNGKAVDIYELVMASFQSLNPGTRQTTYDKLRNNIKELLRDEKDIPQKNEISRVLDQIAKLSYSDTSSTSVIDWQKEDDMITVTDPYFAFYLKWSRVA